MNEPTEMVECAACGFVPKHQRRKLRAGIETFPLVDLSEASNPQDSIATYHQCDRAAARGVQAADQDADAFRHRLTPRPASHQAKSTRSPGTSTQRTSSVVSVSALITRLKGTLFRTPIQIAGRFHGEFAAIRRRPPQEEHSSAAHHWKIVLLR